MENLQLEIITAEIKELKAAITRIENSLSGTIEKRGLLEEHRTIQRQIEELTTTTRTHTQELALLKEFKRDMKKMVAFIAVLVPFAFEIGKGLLEVLWALFRHLPLPF